MASIGLTETLPLDVGAFSTATLLAGFAIVTRVAKTVLEQMIRAADGAGAIEEAGA